MNTRLYLIFAFCLSLLCVCWAARAQATVGPAIVRSVQAPQSTQPNPQAQILPLDDKDGERWRAWQVLPPAVQAKVDPRILAELRGEIRPAHLGGNPDQQLLQPLDPVPLAQTRFLVYLQQQADFSALQNMVFASQVAQRSAVYDLLSTQAEEAQAALRSWLASQLGSAAVSGYQPFTIVNAIAIDGSLESIISLAQRPDVARIVANYPLVRQWQTAPDEPGVPDALVQPAAVALDASNWNIQLVRADRVWSELQVRGEGAVVAGFDTGVSFRHPALVKQYRGNLQNGKFDHNYNWFEPDSKLYTDGNLGASLSNQPRDCDTHGTHTMGTAVGSATASGTQIGMAPGAQWIAVPGICYGTMSGGIRDDIGGLKAFQWLLCPTDLTGNRQTANCSKAPDVVNNSWGSANPLNDVLRPAIQALRAMNIAPVFASGNPRAGAGSIGTPANAPEAITVGATDREDRVASFSGRGPSFYEGEQKPELSAPGVDVKSSVGSTEYERYSGTSMAAPHVTGLIALLVSADLRDGVRDFTVDELEKFMTSTAVELGEPGPDNDYGYGRIDAYAAVRWVLSAGDLRGVVRDRTTNTPLALAKVTGTGANDTFDAASNPAGAYSVTVPAGLYDLTVAAWGYYSGTFAGQTVFAGALSLADFALQPLPSAALQGVISHNGLPVANALVYIEENPLLTGHTDETGTYRFTLPVGRHTLVVAESGYRIQRTVVTVNVPSTNQDVAIESAPSILLVEADAYRGWFEGWPVGNAFTWALDQQGYAYDRWRIRDLTITDTFTLEDGALGYGIPSTTTLQGYDVVIWVQSGCDSGYFGCFYRSSPVSIGADDSLQGYLDQGGRLILSGQDIGTWDDGTPFYDDYLNADQIIENAASTGDTVSGAGFLQTLALTITNASLYGYRNGSIYLSPDAIAAESIDTITYPILRYDENEMAAALAIDPCNATYRAAYFGIGFENIGPRANNRDPAIAEVLGRTVRWVSDAKIQSGFELMPAATSANTEPGQAITYQVQLLNVGQTPITVQVALGTSNWATRVLSGTQEVPQPLLLAPCQTVNLAVTVTPPATAVNGDQDSVVLTVTALDGAANTKQVTLQTVTFVAWQVEEAMPTSRYQLGLVASPNDVYLYAVGGWKNVLTGDNFFQIERASKALERYNVCTQTWDRLAELPGPRANAGTALLNGKLYVMGGNSNAVGFELYEFKQYDSVFVYDIATNSWSEAAPLPRAYTSMAVAALNGKLYVFGGLDEFSYTSSQTYEYDPASNTWATKAAMPRGGRYGAAATALGDKIYIAGGWYEEEPLEIYDPASDTWSVGPALQQGRYSLGLTTAPDGYLYALGGGVSYLSEASAERYSPTTNRWEPLSNLQDERRIGTAAAYAGGRVYAIGGAGVIQSTESLAVASAFCLSAYKTAQNAVGIGTPITYQVTLRADPEPRPNASYSHPLPAKTSFGEFTSNPIGATFNAATQQVEWRGALAAHGTPLEFSYTLNSDATLLVDGERLTSTVQFDNGAGVVFTRTVISLMLAADASNSTKTVDRATVLAGEPLNYTIQIQGTNFVGGDVTVRDPLPATVEYVPDTLIYSDGSGSYDPASRSILWTGRTQAGPDAYLNLSDQYEWGESGGKGKVPSRQYEWIEIGETGTALEGGDYVYTCSLPIGFDFPFYGLPESEFCVSTNGFLSFQTDGAANDVNDCPLPTYYGNEAMIAAVWDDLYIEENIVYQTLGVAPNRHLVVQWNGARPYGASASKLATFQVVLWENGTIRVAIKQAGVLRGTSSSTGIEDRTATDGTTYACNQAGTLRDQQAIVFIPPGASTGAARADIRFQVRSTAGLGANVPLTNTAMITTAQRVFQRQATTLLNPVSLQTSAMAVSSSEVLPGGTVSYQVSLRNSGLFTATNANLTLAVPAAMGYVDGSISCSNGACQHENGTITWSGVLAPQVETTLAFTLRLVAGLPDRTPIELVAQVEDGFGNRYTLPTSVLARRSDLTVSQLQIIPPFVEPGSTVGMNLLIHNSGGAPTNGSFQLQLPASLTYIADSLTCGTGVCTYTEGVVQWQGEIGVRTIVPLRLRVQVPADALYGDVFIATATLNDLQWNESYTLTATVTIARNFYLSLIHGEDKPFVLYLPFSPQQ